MAEFRFKIKELFPQPIIKVKSNLLPHTFRGDRRQCLDATSKISEIIDLMGQLSAKSQGLSKPVTSAQRLRMTENQTIYLLAERDASHNGVVTGLLKVGTKDLYLFDETGTTRKIDDTPCILDFYIHESRQRAGLGKHLFATMLKEEHWSPIKCSVDRPSEKLLGFLSKHYGLVKTIPQANNFVLYEGFFGDQNGGSGSETVRSSPHHANGGNLHVTNSPNTQFFGATYLGDESNKGGRRSSGLGNGHQQQTSSSAATTTALSPNALLQQITQIAPSGRYGARRPTCSMAESRTGVAGGGGASGVAAVTPTPKAAGSQISLTPSQRMLRDTENARKSPLDALSRSNARTEGIQKRSGLQDVDDAYIKANVFARSVRQRNSGLDYTNVVPTTTTNPRGQQQSGGGPMAATVAPVNRMAAGGDYQQQPPTMNNMQQQQQQPMPQGQQQQQPPQQQQQMPPQQMQQQQQQSAQQQQAPPQQPPQDPTHNYAHQQQQGGYPPNPQQQQPPCSPGNNAGNTNNNGNVPPEAEMCTTCPNCQTTIYLVRSQEMGSGDGASTTAQ